MEIERLRAAYPPLEDPSPPAATTARLHALYEAEPLRPPVARPRTRRWQRLGLFALGGVVISGTALAATGTWHPQLGSPGRGPRPVQAATGLPAEQLAALSILRREQTAADRGPKVKAALKVLSGRDIDGIHTDAIRVVTDTPREVAILIPVERFGPGRSDGLCLMSSSYAGARTVRFGDRTEKLPAGFTGWGFTCGNLDTVRATGLETGTTSDPSGGLIVNGKPANLLQHRVAVVPDGVARVAVRLRGGRTVTVPVRDNVYRFDIRGVSANLGTLWYDANGNRIDHRKKR